MIECRNTNTFIYAIDDNSLILTSFLAIVRNVILFSWSVVLKSSLLKSEKENRAFKPFM